MAGNLSSVMVTAPLTCSSFFSVCKACTQYVNFSLIFFGFVFGTERMSKISLVYVFTISDSLPYFSAKMLSARLYPSDVKGNASIVRFTLKSSSSRRYENEGTVKFRHHQFR